MNGTLVLDIVGYYLLRVTENPYFGIRLELAYILAPVSAALLEIQLGVFRKRLSATGRSSLCAQRICGF